MLKILVKLHIFCLTFISEGSASSLPVSRDLRDTVKLYLLKHGYLPFYKINDELQTEALLRFQKFANIPASGIIDEATLKTMSLLRCGVVDPINKLTKRKRKRVPATWRKKIYTWRLKNKSNTLDRGSVRQIIHLAAKKWSDLTGVHFIETVNNEPDIRIKFTSKMHDDSMPFDGRGGVFAHAFLPDNGYSGLGGDIHMDDEENYSRSSSKELDLLWVATHELGHSLGLEHSSEKDSVMYPYYTYKLNFRPSRNDIKNLDYVHVHDGSAAVKSSTTQYPLNIHQTTKKPLLSSSKVKRCPMVEVTAMVYSPRINSKIIFDTNGKIYFMRKHDRQAVRAPLTVDSIYFRPEFRKVDAAFTMKKPIDGLVTIIFSGTYYYIYRLFTYLSGPHTFHDGKNNYNNPLRIMLPLWISNIDAAMRWRRNNYVYIFAGNNYWRYDSDEMKTFGNYPRDIQEAWRGLPRRVDAAYSSDEEQKTFFVSGNGIYVMDDRYVRVKVGYPRHIERDFFSCRNQNTTDIISSTSNHGIDRDRPDP